MKRKLLMALLAGTLAIAAPVSCFAAETTEAAEADAAEDSSDEEEDADAEEADAESADSDDTKEEKTAAKKKEDLKTVGEKTEGCIAFKLRNGTGKKITGLAIKTADETEFPENMMEADDVFELKEKKRVYFSKENSEAETAEETSEDTAPTYDMQLTFEDGTTADVHGIVLEDLGTLTLREKDGIIYAPKRRRVHTILRKQSLTRQLLMQPQLRQQQTRRQLHSRQRVMITPTTTMIIPMITAVGMIIAAVMTAETAAWIMVF